MGYVPTTVHVVFTFCHLQLLIIHNLYYNKTRPYSNLLLLHPEYIFKFTVIMACKVQRTQWYAKFHLSRHIQRDRHTSHIGTKISECEKDNINTKWKEHQKLIHKVLLQAHNLQPNSRLVKFFFILNIWPLLLWLIISQKTAVYGFTRKKLISINVKYSQKHKILKRKEYVIF